MILIKDKKRKTETAIPVNKIELVTTNGKQVMIHLTSGAEYQAFYGDVYSAETIYNRIVHAVSNGSIPEDIMAGL